LLDTAATFTAVATHIIIFYSNS